MMKNTKQKGFTLFVAIVIMATLLLVSAGIVNVAVKESFLTSAGRESQYALFAADTGIECALYWDVKNPIGHSAFSTSTSPGNITCNQDASNMPNPVTAPTGPRFPASVGGGPQSIFYMTFLPSPYCNKVTVTKNPDNTTKIESLGYNTCDTSSTRRVERAVRVTY